MTGRWRHKCPQQKLANDVDFSPREELHHNRPMPEVTLLVRFVGAEHAFVSGSGPTVVGLFWGDHANARADAAAQHLSSHYPHAVCVSPVGADFR